MNLSRALHVIELARARCALAPRVARALGVPPDQADEVQREIAPALAPYRRRIAVAIGKGATAMARGTGPVDAGLCIGNAWGVGADRWGYQLALAPHPDPDATSIELARAARALVEAASDEDVVVVLISGGASAMIEEPRPPLTVDDVRGIARALMARGAPIEELNTVRSALSSIKGGQLALNCGARIITLVASDVVGDDVALVGSGPTIGPWIDTPHAPVEFGAFTNARRQRAIAILEARGLAVPEVLRAPFPSRIVTRHDRVTLVSRMRDFADACVQEFRDAGVAIALVETPMRGEVDELADRIAASHEPTLWWGEPTVRTPPGAGEGGRMQQLALALARRIAGSRRTVLTFGSDGMDGPPPANRPWPAGAFVDGATWGALVAAGIDPDRALARCDAGTALARIHALVQTGPTGINHADVVAIV